MSVCRYLVGDVFAVLAGMEDNSVDFVMSSPPFIALRYYLPADHPDKDLEIGSESTPAEFIDTLLLLMAELRRVVAPHGSVAIELGDTYSGSGGAGGDYADGGMRDGQPAFTGSARAVRDSIDGWPLDKSKCLIPDLFAVALAYGINPLTGERSPAGRWRVRNVITWARSNPPVGALGDKWRPATSDIIIACTATDRYWDEVSTRKPASPATNARTAKHVALQPESGKSAAPGRGGNFDSLNGQHRSGGTAPLNDWWVVNSGGYQGAHFATYPAELLVDPIKAMCPRRVCTTCGQPSRPVVESTKAGLTTPFPGQDPATGNQSNAEPTSTTIPDFSDKRIVGWTDCGCDTWRRGIVLDPFGGSGTTGMVATGLGRDAVLIDIDSRNLDLARERIGMFLAEEVPL